MLNQRSGLGEEELADAFECDAELVGSDVCVLQAAFPNFELTDRPQAETESRVCT